MPDAPTLWIAAAMLWVLDASINISMEPFRAFVADKLPIQQRTTGFVVQSFFIGIGAAVANALPSIFQHFGVVGNAPNGVPLTVQYAFKLGAFVFLLAVLWTVITSKEYPPEDMEAFLAEKRQLKRMSVNLPLVTGLAIFGAVLGISRGMLVDHHLSLWHVLAGAVLGIIIGLVLSGPEVGEAFREMPKTMKQLGVVQFFTWLGLFCMWMFSPSLPRNKSSAQSTLSPLSLTSGQRSAERRLPGIRSSVSSWRFSSRKSRNAPAARRFTRLRWDSADSVCSPPDSSTTASFGNAP